MQIARYFMVGGVAACVDLLIFLVLVYVFDISYLIAAATSFIVATLVNYVFSIKYVFESRARFSRRAELAAVYAVSALGLLINQSSLYFAVEFASLDILPAKILSMGIVFMWNYLSRKHFVFAPGKSNE